MNSSQEEGDFSEVLDDNDTQSAPLWRPVLADKITISVFFAAVILVGIVGNLLIISMIIFVKKLHSTVNLCLASLAVADLTVLIFLPIIPWNILHGLDDSRLGRNFCIFINSIDRGAIACSVMTFLLIGVERYTVLVYPLKSIGMWTYKKVSLLLLLIWIITVGVSVPYGFLTRYKTYNSNNKTVIYCEKEKSAPWWPDYETALYALTVFIPTPVLIILYSKMIIALKSRVPQNDTSQVSGTTTGSTSGNTSGNTAKRSRNRATIMLAALVAIFMITVLPMKIYQILEFFAPETVSSIERRWRYSLVWVFRILLYTNHSANPIVYFIMSDNFREGFRWLFCERCGRRQPAVTSKTTKSSRT